MRLLLRCVPREMIPGAAARKEEEMRALRTILLALAIVGLSGCEQPYEDQTPTQPPQEPDSPLTPPPQ